VSHLLILQKSLFATTGESGGTKFLKTSSNLEKSSKYRFYGFKLHPVCNDRGEPLSFCLTSGNMDDRNPETLKVLTKNLFEKLFGDKGYISSALFKMLFDSGVHLVTGIRSNMKNRLMSMHDRIVLRKYSVIETINDQLKNICETELFMPNCLICFWVALKRNSGC
jgi:hypothetical protein